MNLRYSLEKGLCVLVKIAVIYWFYIFIMRTTMVIWHINTLLSHCISIFLNILFPFFLLIWYYRKEGLKTFVVKDINHKIWLWTFLLCISQYLFIIAFYGYPIWFFNNSVMTNGVIINTFRIVFCTPLVEEILFRGLLQKQLSKNLTPWLSILIVSILFSLCHFFKNIPSMFPAFLTGIICGTIYKNTNKLIVCIFFHSLYNFLASIMRPSFQYVLILQILSFLLALALAVYVVRKYINDNNFNLKFSSQIINSQ